MVRETRYARSGSASIAFQTFGSGPLDLVLGLGWLSNLDAVWEEPRYARFLRGLASFAHVVAYDARGTGLSDAIPLAERLSLDERDNDLLAVINAGSRPPRPWSDLAQAGSPSRILRRYIPSVSERWS